MSLFTKKLFKLLLILLVSLFLLISIKNAYAPPPPPPAPTYTTSAHGNTSYGVNRSSIASFGYSRGNCAHCHEQHASIGGAEPQPVDGDPSKWLLESGFVSQFNVPCFDCHTESGQPQYQEFPDNMYTQYNYSRLAGGDTTITCPNNIARAFVFFDINGLTQPNCSSTVGTSHFLPKIATYLTTAGWGFGDTAGKVDPCSGCHNPHRAKRDPHTTTGRTDGSGDLIVSSVSLPSKHNTNNTVWDLWGDESGERMRDYSLSGGAAYCAPYRYSSTTAREPDGCSATANDCSSNCANGSGLFDSVTLCLDCHINSINGRQAINWGSSGDIHGLAQSQNCCELGDKSSPYPADTPPNQYPNHVLSCLDCHEPHGAPNSDLLREEVNGTHLPTYTDSSTSLWYYFCQGCHTYTFGFLHPSATFGPSTGCGCHGHNRTLAQVAADCPLPGCIPFAPVKTF